MSCSKDDNQQEEIIVEEYSETDQLTVETDEAYKQEDETVETDSAYSEEEQTPETYSIEEEEDLKHKMLLKLTIAEMLEKQEVAETSEIDEIVVPSTEEAEKVHQQHSTKL